MPVTATVEFVEQMRRQYPEAYRDPALWNLLGYLARGWYHHRERHRLQLSYQLLAGMGGGVTARMLAHETYPEGERLLAAIRRIIGRDRRGRWRLEWSEAYTGKQPRLVKELRWPPSILQAIERERRSTPWDGQRRVYWNERTKAGEPRRFDPAQYQAKTNRELDELEASLRVEAHPIVEVNQVLGVLQGAPPNALSRLLKANFHRAFDRLDEIKAEMMRRAAGEQDAGAREKLQSAALRFYDHQLRCLEAIKETSRPRYFVSPNSPRLFPISDHLTALTADVRRTLLEGLVEVDLVSCHLAILAKILDLKRVRTFLEGKESIWDYLFRTMRLQSVAKEAPLRKRIKDVLKQEGLYPALYGRQRGQIIQCVDDRLTDALVGTAHAGKLTGIGRRFVQDPMISEILSATADKLREIGRSGSLLDVDGRRIALPTHHGDIQLSLKANPKTALCYAAGVIELKLMTAIVRLQQKQQSRRFQILLWQHDGVSLHIKDKSRVERVLGEIKTAVAEEASRLGVHTHLEIEPSTLPKGAAL